MKVLVGIIKETPVFQLRSIKSVWQQYGKNPTEKLNSFCLFQSKMVGGQNKHL